MNTVASRRIAPRRGSWADYEREKARWISENPTATHDQYEQAMRAIARRLGV